MSKWPQKSSEHFTNILWARWGWANLKKRKDEMRENLCRDKIMREDMNGGTMRNKKPYFLSERRRMRSEASHTVHDEQNMSRLWAGGDTHKKGRGKIVEWTRKKNKTEERTKRQGEEKIRWAERRKWKVYSWAVYEQIMSDLWAGDTPSKKMCMAKCNCDLSKRFLS